MGVHAILMCDYIIYYLRYFFLRGGRDLGNWATTSTSIPRHLIRPSARRAALPPASSRVHRPSRRPQFDLRHGIGSDDEPGGGVEVVVLKASASAVNKSITDSYSGTSRVLVKRHTLVFHTLLHRSPEQPCP